MQRGGGAHAGPPVYFSLDLYVEAIEEPAVGCRVPAVSFDFLDFPPIKIFSATPEAGLRRPGGQGCFDPPDYLLTSSHTIIMV